MLLGLRVEDLLNEANPDYQTALKRMTSEQKENRNARFRRAIDLSLKRKHLPPELQNYDIYEEDMMPLLREAEAEANERAELTGKSDSMFKGY